MLVRFPLNRNLGRGNGVHCSVDHDAVEGRVGHVTHFIFFPQAKSTEALVSRLYLVIKKHTLATTKRHQSSLPVSFSYPREKLPSAKLPPPSVLRAIFNHIHKSPIIRITNLIHPILGVWPAGRARWVRSRHTFQRRRTTVAHARRQRPRVAGVGLAARECDVRVAQDGEVLVAVVEALGEEAKAGAVIARVAVGEEGDVCASEWLSVISFASARSNVDSEETRFESMRVWR